MVRFRVTPPAIGFKRCKHSPSTEFSRGDGPILMTIDSELVVGVAYITEKISLSLWIEKTESGQLREGKRPIVKDRELFPIDSCNPIFSHPKMRQFLGLKIIKITLRESTNIKKLAYSSKALYLLK